MNNFYTKNKFFVMMSFLALSLSLGQGAASTFHGSESSAGSNAIISRKLEKTPCDKDNPCQKKGTFCFFKGSSKKGFCKPKKKPVLCKGKGDKKCTDKQVCVIKDGEKQGFCKKKPKQPKSCENVACENYLVGATDISLLSEKFNLDVGNFSLGVDDSSTLEIQTTGDIIITANNNNSAAIGLASDKIVFSAGEFGVVAEKINFNDFNGFNVASDEDISLSGKKIGFTVGNFTVGLDGTNIRRFSNLLRGRRLLEEEEQQIMDELKEQNVKQQLVNDELKEQNVKQQLVIDELKEQNVMQEKVNEKQQMVNDELKEELSELRNMMNAFIIQQQQ